MLSISKDKTALYSLPGLKLVQEFDKPIFANKVCIKTLSLFSELRQCPHAKDGTMWAVLLLYATSLVCKFLMQQSQTFLLSNHNICFG